MTTFPLHEFITINREEIIRRCRAKVAARSMPPPTEDEISHGVPLFLDQLVDALRLGLRSTAEIEKSAILHGRELLRQGFTVSQVVQDYGDVCQSVTALAVEMNARISTDHFRTLNLCLDDAIGGAVTAYGRGSDQSRLQHESVRGSERLGYLAHQVRRLVDTALIAVEALKSGKVGAAGSTAAVLQGSLVSIRALVSQSLTDVRLPQRALNRERFLVSGFIDELTQAATLEAAARDITLSVMPVEEEGVAIEADRAVLSAAMGNLLQNAFKFTAPHTAVTLRVCASAERVLIEVQDECGGLPDENVTELFRPFEELSAVGSNAGLGLAFSRWGVEANDGKIYARNLPEKGCVFTVDLPRRQAAAAGAVLLMLCHGLAGCAGSSQAPTAPTFAPPSIQAISVTTGSTGGGTPIRLTGTGFERALIEPGVNNPGSKVTIGGVAVTARFDPRLPTTDIFFDTPAHAAGAVDIVVTNPDRQVFRLPGAYTYVAPDTFDFNGNWFAYVSDDMVIKFTIRDNALASALCETAAAVTFSPPPAVSAGEFSVFGNDGVGISGRIVSESFAIGTSNLPPCGPGPGIEWVASKY